VALPCGVATLQLLLLFVQIMLARWRPSSAEMLHPYDLVPADSFALQAQLKTTPSRYPSATAVFFAWDRHAFSTLLLLIMAQSGSVLSGGEALTDEFGVLPAGEALMELFGMDAFGCDEILGGDKGGGVTGACGAVNGQAKSITANSAKPKIMPVLSIMRLFCSYFPNLNKPCTQSMKSCRMSFWRL
jgi:hypothetical protein